MGEADAGGELGGAGRFCQLRDRAARHCDVGCRGEGSQSAAVRLLGGSRDRAPAYAGDNLWYSLSLDELAASAMNVRAKRHRRANSAA